jgi:Fe-S cluster biosynthesis and repair protein YggX
MPDINTRIEQFRKMAHDDPDNELGHFSLGRAYLDAGMHDGAIAAFERVLQINPNMSRAYELSAVALLAKNQRELAIEKLAKGIQVAQQRGDVMPRNEMIKMMRDLWAAVPQLHEEGQQQKLGEGQVLCSRCGQVGSRLPEPPFRNAQGKEIQEKVCQPCWREWIKMGTKVINELRLPLSDPQAQKMFDQHMNEFLNLR